MTTGQIIQGRYVVQAALGQGGFGAVYLAEDVRLKRQVALKATFDHSADAVRQFAYEATTLAHLRHPNLPTVSDHFTEGNEHYLVMDYIPGEDLGQRLVRQGKLSESEALAIMRPVLDALAYLHAQQPPVIHRDIKPGNIRITPTHAVFLVDFGLAKAFDVHNKTMLAAQAVTPGFSPLEQYGRGTTDARSDLYAAGALLYTMLTGHEPLEAPARLSNPALPSIRQFQPNVAPQLDTIVVRLLAMEPQHRYPSAGALQTDLLAMHSQKLCTQCGASNRAASQFCSKCGAQQASPSHAQVTVVVPPPGQPALPTLQVYQPGASRRYDTLKDSPARALTDGATVVGLLVSLVPWVRADSRVYTGLSLAGSPFGYQFEVIVAFAALLALIGLLFVRRQLASTRTALARWKLLLGIALTVPALDILLTHRFDNEAGNMLPLGGAWLTVLAGSAIAIGAASDIVGWRLPPAAFEPGYAAVIRGAHICTVALLALCGVLTVLGGYVALHSLSMSLLLTCLVGIGVVASFFLPDRLPRSLPAWAGQP